MIAIPNERLRERAREKVIGLELAVTQTAFADSHAELEEELELARIALASLEAEPVAWRYRTTDINGNPNPNWSFSEEASLLGLYQPLYAAPPAPLANINPLLEFAREYIESWDLGMAGDSSLLASAKKAIADSSAQQLAPVSVPDEAVDNGGQNDEFEYGYLRGWNECRAAMLRGGKS